MTNGEAGFLLLEDGTLFHGTVHGGSATAVAEVVFTTNMTGYQEVFTDPSYTGQTVVITAPMLGNYGINDEDPESARPQVRGVVAREISRSYSNWRATGDLLGWLNQADVPVIEGVDTRQLTRHLRSAGAMRGIIARGTEVTPAIRAELDASPTMEGLDLASVVSTESVYVWGRADATHHIVAVDFGIKRNILRIFEASDCRVTVVPSATTAAEILQLQPDGLFLSNGPGDPAAVPGVRDTIRELAEGGLPVFGICLGHQLLGLTFGASTLKLPFGHHGGNHPVKELDTGLITITSQNHGFAVDGNADGIPGAPDLRVTHVNLNDGTVEGLRHRELAVFGVQYHPEAAPGPHDAAPLFDAFLSSLPEKVV